MPPFLLTFPTHRYDPYHGLFVSLDDAASQRSLGPGYAMMQLCWVREGARGKGEVEGKAAALSHSKRRGWPARTASILLWATKCVWMQVLHKAAP